MKYFSRGSHHVWSKRFSNLMVISGGSTFDFVVTYFGGSKLRKIAVLLGKTIINVCRKNFNEK